MIFETPELTQFIIRTPKFKAHDEARVFFSNQEVSIRLPQTSDGVLELGMSCASLYLQLLALAQVWNLSFPQALTSAVKHLYILEERVSPLCWQDDIGSNLWLLFFSPFITVKCLYISWEFAPYIVPTLKRLGGRVTEVLPTLQCLFWRSHSHRDLSRMPLDSSLPHESLRIALLPFLAGKESRFQ